MNCNIMTLCSSKRSKCYSWPQWLAAFHVYLMTLVIGITLGWMSPFLAKLLNLDLPFEVTKEQTTWIASLFSLSRPFASITGAIVSTLFGSKLAVYTCGVYFFFGWICLICANSIKIIYITLLLNGFAAGTLVTTFPIYISEIADPKIRGRLVSFAMDGNAIGFLLGNIMGTYLDHRLLGVIGLIPTFFYLVSFAFFPHTPYHLIRCNKENEAVKSIEWYSRDVDSSKEFDQLSNFIKDSPSTSFFETLRQLKTPANRNALIKIILVYCFLPFTGIYVVPEYMEVLLIKSDVTVIEPSTVVIITSIICICTGWTAMYTSDKFGRKKILLFSCIIMSLTHIVWGLYFHLVDFEYRERSLQWMAIISVTVYRMVISLGLIPIIATIMIETLAPNIKNMGSCMCGIANSICRFITSKNFQLIVDCLTYKYVFYFLAGFSLFLGVYVRVFFPETKGKTLQEIQEILNRDKHLKKVEISEID